MPRPKAISHFARSYSLQLRSLEHTRNKVENLLHSGHLAISDVEQVYAGLFLDAFTEFEALIEDVFIALLSGTHNSTDPSTRRRIRIHPLSYTREVLFEGKNYLDWLPFKERTLPRATRFLNDAKPFSVLSPAEVEIIQRLHLLRNAVAHKSDTAKVRFEQSIQTWNLLPNEKTPTGFLRSLPHGPGGLNQYQIAVSDLESIARKLCQ